MDNSITTYIHDYNIFAKNNGLKKISIFEADEQLKVIYGIDKTNIYDKLENIYINLKKYNLENMCKVYCSGKQIIIPNNTRCNVCSKTFRLVCGATMDNDKLIHASCRENNYQKMVCDFMEEKFKNNNMCKICDTICERNQTVMLDDSFYHKSCCINKALARFKDMKCYLCCKHIIQRRNIIEYCIYNDGENEDINNAHLLCAKGTAKTLKFKKNKVNLSPNKCGLCLFYTMDDKYFHTICQKKLKQVKE